MTPDLLNQMADEFCRWPLPESVRREIHRPEGTGIDILTYTEALQMFAAVVGPKIAELERRTEYAEKFAAEETIRCLDAEAENARLRAAFEKPVAWMQATRFGNKMLSFHGNETSGDFTHKWPLFTKPEGLK